MESAKIILTLSLMVASGSVLAASKQTTVDDGGSGYRFEWPIPGIVEVTERVDKGGESSTLRYTVEIDSVDDRVIVTHRNFRFIELNGNDAQSTALADVSAAAEATAAAAAPAFVLTESGQFAGAIHDDSLVEKVAKTLPPSMNAELRANILRGLESPMLRQAGEEKLKITWNAWVGYWIGLNFKPGETRVGEPHKMPEQMKSLRIGRDAVADGPATLSMEISIAIDDEMLGGWARQIGEEITGQKAPEDTDATATDATRTERVEALVAIESLKPMEVRREIEIEAMLNGELKVHLETYHYSFDWQ